MTVAEQRTASLCYANEIRCGKARLKRELQAQPSRAAAFALVVGWLRGPSRDVGAFAAGELLLACRQVGPEKASRLLRHARIAPTRRVRDLTDRQRHHLALILVRQIPAAAVASSTGGDCG